jgi:predicted RNase H-like nuclease
MDVVGVDGCRGGWFAVVLGSGRSWAIDVYKTIAELWDAMNSPSMILIDIPIGLPQTDRRICDVQARKLLGRRGSSVFAVPCREALQAKNYRQACRINKQVTGVKLSIQTWNICSKIQEIDIWLQVTREAQPKIRESHPELCFWALAGKHTMAHSKKTLQGFTERFSILKKVYPQSSSIVKQALNQFQRKDLPRDDILDAIVLAVCALFSAGKLKTVPPKPPVDKKGLVMEIVYPPACSP